MADQKLCSICGEPLTDEEIAASEEFCYDCVHDEKPFPEMNDDGIKL